MVYNYPVINNYYLVNLNLLSESVVSRPGPCTVDRLSPVGPLSESDTCLSACSTYSKGNVEKISYRNYIS